METLKKIWQWFWDFSLNYESDEDFMARMKKEYPNVF